MQVRKRTEAKNSFEGFLYGARNEINDAKKLGKVLSESDKTKLQDEIKKQVEWLEKNQNLDSAEYKKKEAEFSSMFKSIVEAARKKQETKGKQEKDEKGEL